MLVTLVLAIVAFALYYCLALPRLRQLAWWDAGSPSSAPSSNGRAPACSKVLDWSQLLGADSAGRVMVIMGVVMIVLRLVTRTAVDFKAES